MRRIVKLPPLICDIAGATACMQVPNYSGVLLALYIVGRRASDVERIVLKVYGVELIRFDPCADEDGARRTGGEVAQQLQALRGFGPDKLVLPFHGGLDLVGSHLWLEITLRAGVEPGRTQLFAKLDE